MIAHVVLMKPRSGLSDADRQAFVSAFERAVRDIPTVRDVRVGRRVVHGTGYEAGMADTADYIAIVDFDDVAGLHAYLAHPAHVELGALFGRVLSAAQVYDFQVGGIESIRRLADPI